MHPISYLPFHIKFFLIGYGFDFKTFHYQIYYFVFNQHVYDKNNCNYHNDKIIFIKIGTYTAHRRKNQCHSKEEKENLVHSWFTNIFSLPS